MISFDDLVNILKAMKKDSWGISVESDVEKDVECKIMYSLKLEELENAKGQTVKVTAKIYFDGLYIVDFGDKVNFIDDFGKEHTLEILDIKPIKDFSNQILYTRVTV